MAPDNTFLAFYNLDLSENELATQLTDDISYDIGSRFLGTGNIPAPSKWKLLKFWSRYVESKVIKFQNLALIITRPFGRAVKTFFKLAPLSLYS